MSARRSVVGGLATLLGFLLPGVSTSAAEFERLSLEVSGPLSGLALLDANRDGYQDLLVVRPDGLEVLDLSKLAQGSPPRLAHWPRGDSRTMAWALVQYEGQPDQLLVVKDHGRVYQLLPCGEEPREVLHDPQVLLPEGVYPLGGMRDYNWDGRIDLALPQRDGLRFYLSDGEVYQPGPRVNHRLEVGGSLPDRSSWPDETGLEVTVPSFLVTDQNGDGYADLIFRSHERVLFFWSDSERRIPEEPTFVLDLDEVRSHLPERETDVLDPSNLLKGLQRLVKEQVEDLDGDGIADLLLRQGSKLSIYRGTKEGIERGKATQVLRSSGNLLTTFVTDENRDGRLDLCMLRVAKVSMGDAILWFIMGGTLQFDLFTYYQEEPLRFARRPSRRRTVNLSFPSLLGIQDELEGPVKEWSDSIRRVPLPFNEDDLRGVADVASLDVSGRIDLFRQVPRVASRSEWESTWADLVGRFDRQAGDDGELTVPLVEVVDWVPSPGSKVREEIRGRQPVATLVIPEVPEPDEDSSAGMVGRPILYAADVNGDGQEDLLALLLHAQEGPATVTLFLSGS